MIAFLTGLPRLLSPKGWIWLGVTVAALALALWLFNAGGDAVREDVAAEAARVEVKAGKGRETAGTERHLNDAAIDRRLEEWNRDAEQTPDAAPDDRELRRRCRQLWDAGTRDVPACRRFTG